MTIAAPRRWPELVGARAEPLSAVRHLWSRLCQEPLRVIRPNPALILSASQPRVPRNVSSQNREGSRRNEGAHLSQRTPDRIGRFTSCHFAGQQVLQPLDLSPPVASCHRSPLRWLLLPKLATSLHIVTYFAFNVVFYSESLQKCPSFMIRMTVRHDRRPHV